MDEGTLIGSLDRIEAALDRLEACAAKIAAQESGRPAAPPIDADLEQRHSALRSSVETALARIDTLLAARAE
ncbi:hypothetical protein ABVV53_10975 [Novosphingobium sp. RD2P27]|uniref:Uncharacterized protein n=1 Tax=Novosphingobium kalidii TaxID=3230299 RepID=A0ABV2D2A5_9SPHN